MTASDYRAALDAAIKEYEALGRQRREIDDRLAQLGQTIGTLTRLLGLTPTVPLGLTDACRMVLRHGHPMTPVEVRDRLLAIGIDVSKYANDLAAVHTDLETPEQLRRTALHPARAGKHQYAWNRPATPVALTPDIVAHMHDATHEREAMRLTTVPDEEDRRPPRAPRTKPRGRSDDGPRTLRRRVFAEEIRTSANLRTAALVDALAAVPREQFLRPGPWTIRGEGDVGGPARQTPDADPRHLYDNVSVAIDPERQLFNGGPGAVVPWIDALNLRAGHRVLHLGCGLGYYSAVMAHVVGPTGHVLALEADSTLAQEASQNLAAIGSVEVRARRRHRAAP